MKFTFPPESRPLDGYTIKRAIHRGGFGEVYYALSDAGKEVALKLLQQNLEIELRGVRQCMNLKHPNLVTIFDIRTDADGDHWIVMEYVHGKSLDKVVDEFNGPMPIEEVERWLAGIVTGLGFLHDRGIVHRDLKPANVFQENNVVKIGDVGLAKFITQSKRSAQTESVGTVYYMAPEVARGRYGHEVDVYSLGIVLYEMLTGRVPFDGESTAEILMKHLSDRPDLSPVPKRLRPVLAEALEKDPLKRTPSAEQMLANFRKAVAGIDIPTTIPDESFVSQPASSEAARRYVGDAKPDKNAGIFEWPAGVQQTWDHVREKLDRKAARHARIVARRDARSARRAERKASRRQHEARKTSQERAAATPVVDAAGVETSPRPSTPQTSNGRAAAAKPSCKPVDWSHWLKVGAIILVVFAVIAPRGFVSIIHLLVRVALLGGIGFGVYKIVQWMTGPAAGSCAVAANAPRQVPVHDLEHPPSTGVAPAVVAPGNVGRPPGRSKFRRSSLKPETPRQISLRARVTELTGSLAFAVLGTGILTAAVAFLSPTMHSPDRIAFFGAVSLLASWAILFVAKWFEGTRASSRRRRFVTMVAGGLVGAAAFGLHNFLLLNLTIGDYNLHARGLVHTIGTVNLTNGLQPTLAGYVVFFAGLFVLRRWWRNADSLRRRRVAVGSVLLTTGVGMMLSLVTTFPMIWGVTWAAAISCIVHLSAAWMAPEDRREVMEARHA